MVCVLGGIAAGCPCWARAASGDAGGRLASYRVLTEL